MNNSHLDYRSAVEQAKDFIQERRFNNGFDLATPEGYRSYLANFAGSLTSYNSWTSFYGNTLAPEELCEFKDQKVQENWDRNVNSLIIGAKTDVVVFQALLMGIASDIENGAELHPRLRTWVALYLRGKILPPRRKGRLESTGLHNLIAHAVADLVGSGMKPAVRGGKSPKISACDAVADALAELKIHSITFHTVKGIWQKWKKSYWIG